MKLKRTTIKELVPLEHYLEELLRKRSRMRSVPEPGFVFEQERQCFLIRFLGREYEITYPDCRVTCLDDRYGFAPVEEAQPRKGQTSGGSVSCLRERRPEVPGNS